MALVLAHTSGGALSMWFTVSAILSGGLAGLFLLAFLSRRASRAGVYAGIAACLLVSTWGSLTAGNSRVLELGAWNYPWHELTIGAAGHLALVAVGWAMSLLWPERAEGAGAVTIWSWWRGRYTTRPPT